MFPISTFSYPGADPSLMDINGEVIFSLYVLDGRRFSEFHREHWLGLDFDGNWMLAEENVQKVYSEPKPSLRQRLFGSR